MNTKCFITVSISAFILSSAAQAADVKISHKVIPVVSSIVEAPIFSWTGFYLGGQFGDFSSRPSLSLLGDANALALMRKNAVPQPSGLISGVYAGSNVDVGNGLILGIDTDINWVEREDTKTVFIEKIGDDNAQKGDVIHRNHTLKQKWTGATRMRVGFAINRMMPYVSAGIAYTRLQNIISTSIKETVLPKNVVDSTKAMVGYTLAAGVDFVMTDNFIARAEYRYADFGKKKFVKNAEKLGYKTNDFRIGVAYKF
ncbi:outer membrane protein [Bartonella sp. A05]|uniref:outer membrane protein n=1 Tax=Bartonella sp. A05 TaxID=2967261 RepID=UPI0022A97FA7|nr:outer membrane protein [Bartonella sp. A05]MCZ2203347.1 porin family protein [Bartonella sp. A05]